MHSRNVAGVVRIVHSDHDGIYRSLTDDISNVKLKWKKWIVVLSNRPAVYPHFRPIVDCSESKEHPILAGVLRGRCIGKAVPAHAKVLLELRETGVKARGDHGLPPSMKVIVGAMEAEAFSIVVGIGLEAPKTVQFVDVH
jgi:hypothetical protein